MSRPRAAARDLRAAGLSLAYDGARVVHDLDLAVPDGRVTVIVGANASGKSTLLRGLARIMRPAAGAVTLDGDDIHRLPTKQVARIVGLLPQQPQAPDGITVADLVARGRHPHGGWLRGSRGDDDRIVAEALAATGTLALAGRRVDELSGGQRQRVWIAMALAQDPEILLLDEPTTFLDIAHQIDVLDLLHELNRGRGTTVVMVLHDLNLSARYADHLVVMAAGRIVAAGPPGEVISPATVGDAFGLEARVVEDPVCGAPMVVPVGRVHRAPAPGASDVTAGPPPR
ncbi:ABC transporter ATP-binding protein [Miltoncostaea marina]|uniref:ABC transporter ATP-binding protein n=1 Tax=Miltoncostaea marina TaxID=2843215 RepID=UPI001FE41A52|nr:ABC transporter ATP-binding protein [Miltoncostaea marina]